MIFTGEIALEDCSQDCKTVKQQFVFCLLKMAHVFAALKSPNWHLMYL